MKWFLNWLDSIGRKRVIMDRLCNEPYLERYYLFLKDRNKFPFNVFLHKFLKGGYYEWVPVFDTDNKKIGEICHWRGPGHFRICSANSYHRVELDPDVTAWTLFMPGPHKRDWGFLVNNKWIQNETYLKERYEASNKQ